jgi:ANTAR domain-containing protein/GAF domain-containing protein
MNVDGAGVTVMISRTVRETMHATDRLASELEEWQLTLGEGPCVDAFDGGGPVLAADLDSPRSLASWPVFAPAALGSGARAVFALPLQVGAIRLGVLDLYRAQPGSLSPRDMADALAFADTAGMVLLDVAAGAQPDTADLAWQRDDPTAQHAQVHQATGMMLVQLGVNVETAFARLRAYAYANDRHLGDVARDVVERRLRFEPEGSSETDPPVLPNSSSGGHDEK